MSSVWACFRLSFTLTITTLALISSATSPPQCDLRAICYALDQSGSISDAHYQVLQKFTVGTAQEFHKLTRPGEKTEYSAVAFSFEAMTIAPPTFDLEHKFVEAVQEPRKMRSSTNIFAGMRDCHEILQAAGTSDNRALALIVVTDGHHNRGGVNPINEIKDENIAVVTVGVGNAINETALSSWATKPKFFVPATFQNLSSLGLDVVSAACGAVESLVSPTPQYSFNLSFLKTPTPRSISTPKASKDGKGTGDDFATQETPKPSSKESSSPVPTPSVSSSTIPSPSSSAKTSTSPSTSVSASMILSPSPTRTPTVKFATTVNNVGARNKGMRDSTKSASEPSDIQEAASKIEESPMIGMDDDVGDSPAPTGDLIENGSTITTLTDEVPKESPESGDDFDSENQESFPENSSPPLSSILPNNVLLQNPVQPSPSSTATPSVSFSSSPSASSSSSTSPSSSSSPSISASRSSSPSPSASSSSSMLPSSSSSPSISASRSSFPSPSASSSSSILPSVSSSPSISASGSSSPSPSASSSSSIPPSSTPTMTPSTSFSSSLTASPTASSSSSPIPSATPTMTSSMSVSPSTTASASASSSSSILPSSTPTMTSSTSVSPSSTSSPSVSSSSSSIPSSSSTPSNTPFSPPSASSTSSLTASPIASSSPTYTAISPGKVSDSTEGRDSQSNWLSTMIPTPVEVPTTIPTTTIQITLVPSLVYYTDKKLLVTKKGESAEAKIIIIPSSTVTPTTTSFPSFSLTPTSSFNEKANSSSLALFNDEGGILSSSRLLSPDAMPSPTSTPSPPKRKGEDSLMDYEEDGEVDLDTDSNNPLDTDDEYEMKVLLGLDTTPTAMPSGYEAMHSLESPMPSGYEAMEMEKKSNVQRKEKPMPSGYEAMEMEKKSNAQAKETPMPSGYEADADTSKQDGGNNNISRGGVRHDDMEACKAAYSSCKFRLGTSDSREIAMLKLPGVADKRFSGKLKFQKKASDKMGVGIVNMGGVAAEFIHKEGRATPITDLGSPRFVTSTFKYADGGLAHQVLRGTQVADIGGRCVRVWISEYQLLDRASGNVAGNIKMKSKDERLCVVFQTVA